MKIRLTIAEGDHFDIEVKPFDELTVADHIRIYESDEKDTGWSHLDTLRNRITRITGAPNRFIRIMSEDELNELVRVMNEQTAAHDRTLSAIGRVYETLDNWPKEHDGKDWTTDEAEAVMRDHHLFRERVEVNGRTYTAPRIDQSATFGQWIDLQSAVDMPAGTPESDTYVRALAILMDGDDGRYPVQANDESDAEYRVRANAYTQQRRNDFMAARFVDVLGAAAFFFFNSERFAAICAHSMRRFQSLMPRSGEPMRRVIPRDGGHMQNSGGPPDPSDR